MALMRSSTYCGVLSSSGLISTKLTLPKRHRGFDQGVHGAAEGQIAAQADGQVGDTAEARLQRGQVGERLRRMHVRRRPR